MKDYSESTDEELIIRIRNGEAEISDYLISKYKNLVRQKARPMFIFGGDGDDLLQEGMIGLYKAIRDFDPDKETLFSTFANICVTRQLLTAIEASGRKKNSPLNDYISFYEKDAEDAPLLDAISTESQRTPEQLFIDKELESAVEEIMKHRLSSLEREAMHLYIEGYGISEISEALGKDEKSTDNALQRAKSKLKKNLLS